jgi:hypothetical protein
MPETELATPPAQCIPDRSRLSRAEEVAILKLRELGKTQVEIAQIVGCNQSSVSRCLDDFEDTRGIASHILRNGAADLAKTVVKTKHAGTALEALRDMEVSQKRAPDQGKGGGVQVFIGVQDGDVQVTIGNTE